MTIERERGRKSVPRSTPIGTERGTLSGTAERGAEREAERPAEADAKTLARQARAPGKRRNAARNAKRNGSAPGRSTGRSVAAPSGTPTRTPANALPPYAPSKVFPLHVLEGATKAEQTKQVTRDLTAPETAAVRVMVAAEGASAFGEMLDTPGALAELRRVSKCTAEGDLSHAEAMLISQAQAMQTLSVRLIERGLGQSGLPQFEAFMRLGLRAQAQSRQALETLAVLKQGPAVFARQANVAHGPQQVVNGPASAPPPCAAAKQKPADPTIIEP